MQTAERAAQRAPQTKEDILRALANLGSHELTFWLAIDPGRFARPFGEAWSPADTVRHLRMSRRPSRAR